MAEWQQIRRSVQLEFAFDRLRAAKLEQAYDILVPDQVRIVGGVKKTEKSNEDRGDPRSCFVGQTKGREHDRQPDSAQPIERELKLDATSYLLPLSHAGAVRPGMLPPPA